MKSLIDFLNEEMTNAMNTVGMGNPIPGESEPLTNKKTSAYNIYKGLKILKKKKSS